MKEKEKVSEVLTIMTVAGAMADARAIMAVEVADEDAEDAGDAEEKVTITITKRISCVTIVTRKVTIQPNAQQRRKSMQT